MMPGMACAYPGLVQQLMNVACVLRMPRLLSSPSGNMPALDDELHVPHGAAYCSYCMRMLGRLGYDIPVLSRNCCTHLKCKDSCLLGLYPSSSCKASNLHVYTCGPAPSRSGL